MGFNVFKFHPRIAAGIKALGFSTPTPIQSKSIPPVMTGKDVLGLAQTGTGKTAAFVLPILERLLPGPRLSVRALILAPTRELAEQTHTVICALTPYTGLKSAAIYGGVSAGTQRSILRAGVEIVVACPGRLLDHFKERTINVTKLEVLVIDEADRMFDMGFLPDLRKVISHLPKKRQTLLFSATMPEDIRKLTNEVLHEPVTVQAGVIAPVATVEHAMYPISQALKTALLIEILKRTKTGSVLVFTRTKHRAKKLARMLAREGHATAELQGNLSQNRRQESLDGFRSGKYRIMVATDIAARGIDVSTISHVINYDIPDTADAYTHRIGRTGRMERTGDAFTFVTPEDADMVREIERVLKARVERRKLDGFDYSQQPLKEPSRGELRGHGGGRQQPLPSGERTRHAESRERQQPAPSGERTRHAENRERQQPAANRERTRHAENRERHQHAANRERTRHAESRERQQPAANRERTRHAESRERQQPAPSGEQARHTESRERIFTIAPQGQPKRRGLLKRRTRRLLG